MSILLVHSWNQNPEVQSTKYKVQHNEHTLFTSERTTTGSHKLQGRGDRFIVQSHELSSKERRCGISLVTRPRGKEARCGIHYMTKNEPLGKEMRYNMKLNCAVSTFRA